MRKLPVLLGLFLTLIGFSGCTAGRYQTSQSRQYTRDIVLLDGDMAASREWSIEAHKRFKYPLVVTVHGGTENGDWYCFPAHPNDHMKVETLATQMHAMHPENDIVLIVCNEDGHVIHVPHVWYALHKVWVRPTADLFPWEQLERKSSPIVGDIWHFVN